MKKKIVLLILFVFIIGCTQKTDENIDKPVPIKIYKVKTESISKYVHATGTISAEEDVIVYSKSAERVEKIFVKPGTPVSRNQIIAQLKNDVQKQGLEIANSALKNAEVQAKLTLQDFERMQKLFFEKAISQQQFDQIKAAKESAENSLNQAKAAYEQAKEQYENTFIKAPFDGYVAAIYVEENQMINMGQPVAQVISPSKMKSKVYITGKDIQLIKTGQNVRIKFPSIMNEEFNGKVVKMNTSIDQMSKALEVEISILSNDSRLKSGMFGEFFIEVESHPNTIVVPEFALLTQTEVKIDRETGLQTPIRKYFLFVVKDGIAKLREVKTGIMSDGHMEITEGLSNGDTVIVVGQNIVKENQKVKVIE